MLKALSLGYRVAIFFIIQRLDTKYFAPAWKIDYKYSQMLLEAHKKGLEIIPIQIKITPQGYNFVKIVDILFEN